MAQVKVSELMDNIARLEYQLDEAIAAKLEIENSFRKCKSEVRQLEYTRASRIRRVALLETQIQNTPQVTRDADDRADKINDELQTTKRQMGVLEREHTKLQAQYHRLEAELTTAKDWLSTVTTAYQQKEADLQSEHDSVCKKNAKALESAHEQLRREEGAISALRLQHVSDLAAKEKELSNLRKQHAILLSNKDEELKVAQSQHKAIVSCKEKDIQEQDTKFQAILSRKDQEIASALIQHTATITAKDAELEASRTDRATTTTHNESELEALCTEHAATIARKDAELKSSRTEFEASRTECMTIIAHNTSELEALRNEHTTVTSRKDAEMTDMHEQQSVVLARKDSELIQLREKFASVAEQNSDKAKDLEALCTEHAAAIVRKDTEMVTVREEHSAAIAQKNAELDALHNNLLSVTKQKDDEVKELRDQSLKQLSDLEKKHEQDKSPLAVQSASSASEVQLKQQVNGLKILINRYETKIKAMTEEWEKVYFIIQDVNADLPRVLKKLGKKSYTCINEIGARMSNDPESKCEHLIYYSHILTNRQ